MIVLMFIMKIKVFHYMYMYHVFATDTKRWKSGEAVWWHCHSAICWNPDGVEEAGREPYTRRRVLPTEQLQRQSQAIRTSVWRFRYDLMHSVSHDFFFPAQCKSYCSLVSKCHPSGFLYQWNMLNFITAKYILWFYLCYVKAIEKKII